MSRGKNFLALLLVVAVMFTLTACGTQQTKQDAKPESGKSEPAPAKYPEKPITVLQGFKAGGGSDQLAQLTQPFLQKILDGTFTNQYIPGATGAIAWTQLAKNSDKDGYTISITNTPMLMTNYIMNPEITYTIDELTPIANVVTDPGIIVVGKNSPLKTYQDFVDAVKASPGKLTVGNSGTGGDDFFTTLIWEKETGLDVQMVPFEGDGPSWQNAAGHKIDASFTNQGVTYQQVKEGNLRALALFANKRSELLPDVPTLKELGVDIVSGSSRGYSAPKGIPDDAKNTLIAAFEKMFGDPEFAAACEKQGLEADPMTGDTYAKYLKDNETQFKQIWDSVKEQYTK